MEASGAVVAQPIPNRIASYGVLHSRLLESYAVHILPSKVNMRNLSIVRNTVRVPEEANYFSRLLCQTWHLSNDGQMDAYTDSANDSILNFGKC